MASLARAGSSRPDSRELQGGHAHWRRRAQLRGPPQPTAHGPETLLQSPSPCLALSQSPYFAPCSSTNSGGSRVIATSCRNRKPSVNALRHRRGGERRTSVPDRDAMLNHYAHVIRGMVESTSIAPSFPSERSRETRRG